LAIRPSVALRRAFESLDTMPRIETKLEELFIKALEIPSDEREEFIDSNCKNDSILKERLKTLLDSDAIANDQNFLEISAIESEAEIINQSFTDSRIGQIVGQYKIKERLSSGGMGTIYLASRIDDFEKFVALKIIKRGMDTDDIVSRFRIERQILANLEHPNIARLIDGGTTIDGLPYFAMEYVEGVSISDFCRSKKLSVTERLKLFLSVCSAVSYAHQNLIVHRDLKPSNILVTGDGSPKLLDFGIAKLLDSSASENFTKTGMQILTPTYASPEQVRGEQITTAADIYSLGVVLFEMLAEELPFQVSSKNTAELIRMICEKEPEKPSSLKNDTKSKINNPKSLSGDLDNIILKALQKDRTRRYSSVESFANDIRLHLGGLPIKARPDSFRYRAGKFMRRNRIAVGAVALIGLMLVTSISSILWQANKTQIASEKAERRADNLRRLSSSFAVELHKEILNLPGSLHARELLLNRAVEQLDALVSDSDGNPALQDELAQSYYNLGLVPNHPSAQLVSTFFQKGIDLYLNLLADDPGNVRFNQQLTKGYTHLANVEKVRGRSDEALEYLTKANVSLTNILSNETDLETRRLSFEIEGERSAILILQGKASEALDSSRKLLAIGGELKNSETSSDEFDRASYTSRYNICKAMVYLGDYQNAINIQLTELSEWTDLQKQFPNDTRFQYQLWAIQRSLSVAFERNGKKDNAEKALIASQKLIEELLKSSPEDVGYQRNTSFTYLAFGQFWLRQKSFQTAINYFEKARGLSEKIYDADRERGETISDLSRIYAGLGTSIKFLGQTEEGFDNLQKSITFFRKSLVHDPENALLKRDFAETLFVLGSLLMAKNDRESILKTRETFSESLKIWQSLESRNQLNAEDKNKPNEVLAESEKARVVSIN
jgi:eukaryotic-like serine/threonine-protein kinase